MPKILPFHHLENLNYHSIVFEYDGHFTKAAEALQTGRQAISTKMKTLEDDIKYSFFVQNGNIMVPTKKAEEFYLEAKKYKNLPIVMYAIMDYPVISMRFTGEDKIDNVFMTNEYNMCNTKKVILPLKNTITMLKYYLKQIRTLKFTTYTPNLMINV